MPLLQVVYDAILPIVGALAGVIVGSWLTNRGQKNRLREQLSHDARERCLEREMSLRKQVYLEAAEAACASITAIGQLGNLTVSEKQFEDAVSWISGALGKMNIVAGDQTIDAVSRFSTRFGTSSLLLMKKRFLISQTQTQIDSLEEQISALVKESERLADLTQESEENGRFDAEMRATVKRTYEERTDRWKGLVAEKNRLGKVHSAQLLNLVDECISHAAQLNKLLVPAVCAIRRELALPFDERAYARLIDEHTQSMMEAMSAYVTDMKELAESE